MKHLFLPLLGALALGGCVQQPYNPVHPNGNTPQVVPANPAPIADAYTQKTWHLAEVFQGNTQQRIPGAVTLRFQDGNLGGKSLVNLYRMPIAVRGDDLVPQGDLATTRMAGPLAAMRWENAYFSALRQIKHIALEKGQLVLSTQKVRLIYRANP